MDSKPKRKERMQAPKVKTGGAYRYDMLLTMTQAAALKRAKIRTMRDRCYQYCPITQIGGKNYVWLSDIIDMEIAATLTDKEASRMIEIEGWRKNRAIRAKMATKTKVPIQLMMNLYDGRIEGQKKWKETGQVPPTQWSNKWTLISLENKAAAFRDRALRGV